MKHESDSNTSSNWCTLYNPQWIDKRIGELGNKRTSGDHSNYSIIKIDQTTEKIFCHSHSGEKPSAYAGVKNSQNSMLLLLLSLLVNNKN